MAVTPSIQSHDITLGDGTTTLGLMLKRDKGGRPMLDIGYLPSLAEQQFTSLSHAAFRAEYQTFEHQEDWLAGFGAQVKEGRRYMQAIGTDGSFKGIIIPGPVAVATTHSTPTYASTATIANGGFESTPFDSGWTTVSGTWAVETTTVRTGAQAARQVAGAAAELKRKLTAADSSLFNTLAITISAYGRRQSGGSSVVMDIYLKDGSGTEIATAQVTGNDTGWTEVPLSHTFTDGWPELWFHIKFSTNASYAGYLDDCTVSLTGTIATATDMGTVVKTLDFNSAHYAISETGVWKRTTNNWARVAGSPDAITDGGSDGSDLYLARGTSKNYWYMATGETFTRNTGTGASSQPIKMAFIGASMYGTDDPRTVWKYNALASGGTSNTYTVGDSAVNITAILDHEGLPTIAKENNVYQIDSSDNVDPILNQLLSQSDSNTGKNSISWNGNLYVPAGDQSLMEYDSGVVAELGPAFFAERLTDFSGQVVATASDGTWLFVVLDNSTKIEILKGHRATLDGAAVSTDWRWHPFFEDTYGSVTYAQVSTITANRLWYGGGTSAPKYIPLPTQYSDPLTDTNLTFKTGTTHESCWYDFDVAFFNKTIVSLVLDSVDLSGSNRTVKVEYRKLGDTSWTELGGSGSGTFNTSPTQEKFFETGTSAIKTPKIRFRYTLNTDDADVGLGILGATCYAVPNPPRLESIRAVVVATDRGTSRSGPEDRDMTYAIIRSNLHSWADTHPLTLVIPDGTVDGVTYTVKFAEGFPQEAYVDLGETSQVPPRQPTSEFELQFIAQRTS